MSAKRSEWPEVGDLVVVTVQRIVGHGAYITLDEYGDKEGLLHISEISSSWVRNIRNHVRERQKTVLQVLRVDPSKGQIDLSLRRVTQDERRKKIEDWKKNRKAVTILRSTAAALKMSDEEIFSEAGDRLENHYGSLYAGLEAAAKGGVKALVEAGVPEKIASALEEVVEGKIVVKGVTIHGVFEITSMEPRGVEEIKDVLLETMNLAMELDAEASIYGIGAPKYRIDLTADDYRKAESVLNEIIEQATKAWERHDGKITFSRS